MYLPRKSDTASGEMCHFASLSSSPVRLLRGFSQNRVCVENVRIPAVADGPFAAVRSDDCCALCLTGSHDHGALNVACCRWSHPGRFGRGGGGRAAVRFCALDVRLEMKDGEEGGAYRGGESLSQSGQCKVTP